MTTATLALDEAVDLARTGDIWLFRGRTPADLAIQLATNSPVNHVGMAVVLGDLPPLMWHAELGRSLPDVWSGARQRGVQLHVLSDAVTTWANRYGQQAWVRQLSPEVTAAMEDAVLRVIARMDGTPFPSTVSLASRWVTGRLPSLRRLGGRADRDSECAGGSEGPGGSGGGAAARPSDRHRRDGCGWRRGGPHERGRVDGDQRRRDDFVDERRQQRP